ncbi:Elongator subunit elp2 [Coemansia sp. RSA 2598]|nr:Elongator subunit elp2 [Coemansia sp. RSA 2598]
MATKSVFISGACSRTAHAVDSLDQHTVALAMGNHVGLYDPSEHTRLRGVQSALRGHTQRVNCCRFAHDAQGSPIPVLLSGSADNTVRIWQKRAHGDGAEPWQCVSVLSGHEAAVIALDAIALSDGLVLVATASTDGTVRIWQHRRDVHGQAPAETSSPAIEEAVQTLNVGARSALAVALAQLPDDQTIVLASGNTDSRIHVFTRACDESARFSERLTLTGHEDWVTSLDFMRSGAQDGLNAATAHWGSNDVVLASASQDRYVRLWRVSQTAELSDDGRAGAQAMLDACSAALGSADIASQLTTRAHSLEAVGIQANAHAVTLDAVLVGHDGWVHSVRWRAGPTLVTASADGSAICWEPDAAAGVWASAARLGAAGGGADGFLGAVPVGRSLVLAHGYHGSMHLWQLGSGGMWVPLPAPSGHFAPVRDVCWDPHGRCVLTASADQTTRLFAPVGEHGVWREVARPQIHGYDMRCAAFTSPAEYVAGADEKVVRVFRATKAFAESWSELTGQALDVDLQSLAAGASLPVLGLSNKAVARAGEAEDDDAEKTNDTYSMRQTHTDVAAQALAAARDGPPLEEQLLRGTLWPESDKLYAHAYEIHSVASAHAGRWVATACRATADRHAAVRLYAAPQEPGAPWPQPVVLAAHSLTVTRMRFSPPHDQHLLTVSRDRSWALFSRQDDSDSAEFRLAVHHKRAHARIIWDAAWSPDSVFFATASRDKTVKLWLTAAPGAAPVTISFPESVTAIDFVPEIISAGSPRYALAAALESGRIFVLTADVPADKSAVPTAWSPIELPPSCTHVSTVNRLAWCSRPHRPEQTEWLLASASDDNTLRINSVQLS